jgi:hypothetical protein
MQGYDETFWTAVAEEVRGFVTREIEKLKSDH